MSLSNSHQSYRARNQPFRAKLRAAASSTRDTYGRRAGFHVCGSIPNHDYFLKLELFLQKFNNFSFPSRFGCWLHFIKTCIFTLKEQLKQRQWSTELQQEGQLRAQMIPSLKCHGESYKWPSVNDTAWISTPTSPHKQPLPLSRRYLLSRLLL